LTLIADQDDYLVTRVDDVLNVELDVSPRLEPPQAAKPRHVSGVYAGCVGARAAGGRARAGPQLSAGSRLAASAPALGRRRSRRSPRRRRAREPFTRTKETATARRRGGPS